MEHLNCGTVEFKIYNGVCRFRRDKGECWAWIFDDTGNVCSGAQLLSVDELGRAIEFWQEHLDRRPKLPDGAEYLSNSKVSFKGVTVALTDKDVVLERDVNNQCVMFEHWTACSLAWIRSVVKCALALKELANKSESGEDE